MRDLGARALEASRHLEVGLDDARARAAMRRRVHARAQRIAVRRAALGAAAVALLGGGLVATGIEGLRDRDLAARGHTDASVHVGTGRTLDIEGDAAALRAHEVSDERVDVDPQHERPVQVRAGAMRVEVVGTAFVVEHDLRDGSARVRVEHGRVRVECGATRAELGATGESRCAAEAVAPAPAAIEASARDGQGEVESDAVEAIAGDLAAGDLGVDDLAVDDLADDDLAAGEDAIEEDIDDGDDRPRDGRRRARRSWRVLAAHGDFERAYRAIEEGASVRDQPEELLAAADVARLSGHPRHAARLLRRVLDRYGRDPRAPLAAFTLGRLLLDESGDPRGAAQQFARARTLAPRGPLAEDALAREVEARARSGDHARARALGEQYITTYPNGARTRAVRRYAGLPREAP
jgi:transmembrane sensor